MISLSNLKVAGFSLLLLALIILGWPTKADTLPTDNLWLNLLPLAVLYTFYSGPRGTLQTAKILTLGGLFFLSMWLVHAQYSLRAFIGWAEPPERHFAYLGTHLNHAVQVYLLGALAFAATYTFCTKKLRTNRKPYSANAWDFSRSTERAIEYCAAFFFVLFFSLVAEQYLAGIYAGNRNWSLMASYSFKLFFASIITSYALRISKSNRHYDNGGSLLKHIGSFGPLLNSLTFIWVAISIYIGDRGPIVISSLIYIGSFIYASKRLGIVPLLFALIIAATAFTFIGEFRATPEQNPVADRIASAYSNLSSDMDPNAGLWGVTEELGSSVASLQIAIALRESGEITSGSTYLLGGFTTLVPFSGLFLKQVGLSQSEINSSLPITHYIRGTSQASNLGTTPIADLYIIGKTQAVIVFMAFAGFAFAYLDARLQTRVSFSFSFLCAIAYFGHSFYLGRSTLFLPLQYAIIGAIMLSILSAIFRNDPKHRHAGSQP